MDKTKIIMGKIFRILAIGVLAVLLLLNFLAILLSPLSRTFLDVPQIVLVFYKIFDIFFLVVFVYGIYLLIRNNQKYHRLYIQQQHICHHPEVANIGSTYPLPDGKEYHHWNYNFPKSAFIVDRVNGHKRLHQKLRYDEKSKCFYNDKNELLDTSEKHEQFLINTGLKYEFINL